MRAMLDESKTGKLPVRDVSKLLHGVLRGVEHLHVQRVVHGTLRGAAVIVAGDGHAWLVDAGLGPLVPRPRLKQYKAWLAPEVLSGGPFTPAADIWSVGCVVTEMCTGSPPFNLENTVDQVMAQLSGVSVNSELPKAVQHFVCVCMQAEPYDRPKAQVLRTLLRG